MVRRSQPTEFSLLSFFSCALTAGVELGALWSLSSLQPEQWDFCAPLGEQSIHGSVFQGVPAHYEPSQKGFLASTEERDVDLRRGRTS